MMMLFLFVAICALVATIWLVRSANFTLFKVFMIGALVLLANYCFAAVYGGLAGLFVFFAAFFSVGLLVTFCFGKAKSH